MKPTNLSTIVIPPVDIGLAIITKLEIDLAHVNHGLEQLTKSYRSISRSNFSEVEVANIFSNLNGFFIRSSGKSGEYLYFTYVLEYLTKNYLLIFCVHKLTTDTAGIITLYQVKKRSKV